MRRALLLVLALTLLIAAPVRADEAYERVATAYAQAGGQLDPCAFTAQELAAGLAGIPRSIENVVPDLKQAINDGIAAHGRGDCVGREPSSANPDEPVDSGAIPPVTTTPATPAPVTPAGGGTEPSANGTGAPAPAPETAPAGVREDDRTALVLALIALGALLLLVLATWAWGRLRGWDPAWAARARHGWGEAGFRTTTTWSEFTDWLRLGR